MSLTSIILADDTTASIGAQVFNYYDRYPVTIVSIDSDGWCDTTREDGSRGPLLNGERMCSLGTARMKGWLQ